MRLLILNGVNLNLTGTRSPEIYGGETLEDINREIAAYAAACELEPVFRNNKA